MITAANRCWEGAGWMLEKFVHEQGAVLGWVVQRGREVLGGFQAFI